MPHRPSRRVIVDSSPAGSMGVDGLWICWIRLAVLYFLHGSVANESSVWEVSQRSAFHFWSVFGIMVEKFFFCRSPEKWCVLTRRST